MKDQIEEAIDKLVEEKVGTIYYLVWLGDEQFVVLGGFESEAKAESVKAIIE